MAQAPRDQNRVPAVIGTSNADGTTPLPVYVDSATNRLLTAGTAALTTEYTEGDTDATITGVAVMGEAPADTMQPLSLDASNYLNVNVAAGSITVDSEFPAAAAITDNFANPTTTNVMAMSMLWDGSAWDRGKGDSTDGALVNLGANNDVSIVNSGGTNPVDTLGAGADAVANTFNQLVSASMGYVFNGSTWDRAREGSSAGSLLVDLGANNDVTLATLPDTAGGDLASMSTDLGTIDADTDAIKTAVELIDDAIYAEDTGHTTADKGMFMLGVRNTSSSVLTSAQLDYSPIVVDDIGRLKIVVDSGAVTVTGNITAEDADSGNPVKVGGKYDAALPTLTDGDRGNLQLTVNGALHTSLANTAIIGDGDPTIDSYTQFAINLNAGANQVLVSSAASKQIWVYGVGFTLSVAGTVSFQDESDTAITGIMDFAANSGMSVAPSGNFAMPIWKLATDKDLEVDVVTAAIDGWINYAIVSV